MRRTLGQLKAQRILTNVTTKVKGISTNANGVTGTMVFAKVG